ncbi:MAG: hypothetical protein JWR77_2319 [Rhizorhabdus sp.]|nr:hypothetical protein [Rhizorhabdus sp.]
MELLSSGASVFSARVRAVIYAKGLPVEIIGAPDDPRTTEYLALNPIGKLPVLVADDGFVLPESDVIVEYLEDRFPSPSLFPADPNARSTARLIARMTDLYLMPVLAEIFNRQAHYRGDEESIAAIRQDTDGALGLLASFLGSSGLAVGDILSTADCALYPALLLARHLWRSIDDGDILTAHPRLLNYVLTCEQNEILSRIKQEFEA